MHLNTGPHREVIVFGVHCYNNKLYAKIISKALTFPCEILTTWWPQLPCSTSGRVSCLFWELLCIKQQCLTDGTSSLGKIYLFAIPKLLTQLWNFRSIYTWDIKIEQWNLKKEYCQITTTFIEDPSGFVFFLLLSHIKIKPTKYSTRYTQIWTKVLLNNAYLFAVQTLNPQE